MNFFVIGGGRAGFPVRYGVRKEMFKLRLTRLILVTNRVQFYSSKVSFWGIGERGVVHEMDRKH